MNKKTTRRSFLAASTLATGAVIAGSRLGRADDSKEVYTGRGLYKYRVEHAWPQLPDKYSWQTTHNVAVDKANNLYVIHEGRADLKDHPSIFVFDSEGKFIRAFGEQFQGGGHGIEVRAEGGEEFLYVCAYQQVKSFAKLTLKGETIWQKYAPVESGVYAEGEAKNPKKIWGRDRFMPTNFAFLDDGGFLLADGYGSFFIHRYDKEGNWKESFGGPGKGEGKFATPHGIWIDRRPGRDPQVVICDRAHNTLQFFTMDWKYITTKPGFGLPANIDTQGKLMLVPELVARVSLLNEKNEVVVTLGEDIDRISADSKKTIRRDESKWQAGKFVHPHDACFDQEGNIFVAEWVASGRITKLTKV